MRQWEQSGADRAPRRSDESKTYDKETSRKTTPMRAPLAPYCARGHGQTAASTEITNSRFSTYRVTSVPPMLYGFTASAGPDDEGECHDAM